MRKILLFVFVASFLGCEEEILSPEAQARIDFLNWSDSLSLADVEAIYDSEKSLMSDIRTLSETSPFSYQDSITLVGPADVPVSYPHTSSEGMTIVKYDDSLIFSNSWNYSYMDQNRSMTLLEYAEFDGFKLLRLKNESRFPPNDEWPNGYYARENRLFTESAGAFWEIELRSYGISYALGEIKAGGRPGVILLYSSSFIRSYPPYQCFVLLDLVSRESKLFRIDE